MATILSLTLPGCISNKALPEEKPLLLNRTQEKYWLFNLQTEDDSGKYQNHCALITYSPAENGAQTGFFLSQWDESDSSYSFGMHTSAKANWSKGTRWPMLVSIPRDSVNEDWRWYWGRKHMWVDGVLKDPTAQTINMRGTYFAVHPFETKQVHADPDVILLKQQAYYYRFANERQKRFALLNIASFNDASSLLKANDTKAIYWINRSNGLDNLYLLLKLKQDGNIEVLAHYTEVRGPYEHRDIHASIVGNEIWKSPHSHKDYGLGMRITTNQGEIRIRPATPDQEIQAGRNSFWMGAIREIGPKGEVGGPSGNMYIFTR